MGSLAADAHYPDAADRSLVLTHPTAAEKEQTWRLNHGEWGGPLDLPMYLKREPFLASTSLAANGGMVHWILTDAPPTQPVSQHEKRRVLASCEHICKRVLYVPRNGDEVREGFGYGIGSVYTYPEFRGRKYAARMLRELGEVLKTWPEEEQLRKKRSQGDEPDSRGQSNGQTKAEGREAVCSALWSDIGKRFYASKGWPAFASGHVEFPSSSPESPLGTPSLLERSVQPHGTSLTLVPVNTSNLAQLCAEDEAQLRVELIRHAREHQRIAFAFAPDYDVFRWHWAREEFIASQVFPGRQASEVRGMIATVVNTNGAAKEEKTRVWAIWTRNFGAGAASSPAKNTLYILRLVIDDRGTTTPHDPKTLQLAFDAILHSALDGARAWHCDSVHLWNPTPALQGLIAGSGAAHKFVDREVDSIPSMMWYGPDGTKEEEADDVDWIANEKYCWC
ncbi:hypothetical protein GQX73_g581 [Xylaria multiplex]|uniref:LYC1 C-terminal domain-containing protein n=1 Tax=Xylaria multiplex TaxID=323545 RepID=A0A7C8N0I0_9PEZI|nr:hypothetical protein GQX73_g581 [Xylaria multiplex]